MMRGTKSSTKSGTKRGANTQWRGAKRGANTQWGGARVGKVVTSNSETTNAEPG